MHIPPVSIFFSRLLEIVGKSGLTTQKWRKKHSLYPIKEHLTELAQQSIFCNTNASYLALQQLIKPVLGNLLIAIVYYLAANLGLLLAFEQANTSPVWPPTGIAIASLLHYGYRFTPGVFIGAFWVNLQTGIPSLAVLGIASGNTLEALIACYLIRHWANRYPFQNIAHTGRFIVFIILASTVSASIGVGSLAMTATIEFAQFPLLWLTWWLGDASGGLLLAPLILAWRQPPRWQWPRQQNIEVFALTSLCLLFCALTFTDWISAGGTQQPLAFLLLPPMIWSAVRFQERGATLLAFILSVCAIIATLMQCGPFVATTENTSLLLLQAFMAVIVITALTLSASVNQYSQANAALRCSQAQLEENVNDRTAALQRSNLALQLQDKQRCQVMDAMQQLLETSSLNTIDKSKQDFFVLSANNLAKAYDCQYAAIAILDKSQEQLHYLAISGEEGSFFTYALADSIAAEVLSTEEKYIQHKACQRFPKDGFLQKWHIDSYFGCPLTASSGDAVGLICVMNGKMISLNDDIRPLLPIFANRIAMELERRNTSAELELAASVFNESAEAILISDAQNQILRVNPAFCRITGYQAEEVNGRNPRILQSGRHDKAFYTDFWQTLLREGHWQGGVWNKGKSGHIFPVWQTVTSVSDANGEPQRFITIFNDITEKKQSEEKIYHLAHYDSLTTLPNRAAFTDLLNRSLYQSKRHLQTMALLFLDLDNFKLINDTAGHMQGDNLLRQVADRLQAITRREDAVCRLGGDEFTILLLDIAENRIASIIANKVLAQFQKPFKLGHLEINVSASIGIAIYPEDGHDADTLLKHADIAMYRAKSNGRNNYQFFTQEMNQQAMERLNMEQEMRKGFEQGEFHLCYQPQINLRTGQIIGCEALLRWRHPSKGYISPDRFIPVAEECGFINTLGLWVLNTACRQAKVWMDQRDQSWIIAVNISARQFQNQALLSNIEKILQESGLPAQFLELELTESMLMHRVEDNIQTLHALRALGVKLAIDDFGTGYSSLAYLKRFPLDKLKIDRSFIQDLTHDNDDAAIVNATILLAHSMQLTVIAEGVETDEQRDFLEQQHCDELQGYWFSKPLIASELENFCQTKALPDTTWVDTGSTP